MTLELSAEATANLDALKQMHGEVTNTHAIRLALESHRKSLEATMKPDVVFNDNNVVFNGGSNFGGPQNLGGTGSSMTVPTALSLAKNRKEIVQYSNILIVALQEALDYNPLRHHNQQTPALFVEDSKYLSDIKALTKELKHLNKLLERKQTKNSATSRTAIDVGKNVNLFLSNYTPTLAKGSALLTIGVIAALLHSMGLGTGIVDELMARIIKLR